jgi:hypothetical protein
MPAPIMPMFMMILSRVDADAEIWMTIQTPLRIDIQAPPIKPDLAKT